MTGLQLKRRPLKHLTKNGSQTRKNSKLHGHNFEAIAHLKQFSDSCDPYDVYELNDRHGNPDKTRKLKVLFALNMDETKDHILSKEF